MVIPVFLFGAAIGSFLSAYTYRLINGEDIVHGRSHCDHCGRKIPWYDNIPLLSYILLGGKCRYCEKKIPFKYFLTEFFTGLLFALLYLAASKTSFMSSLFSPSLPPTTYSLQTYLFLNSPFSTFLSQFGPSYLLASGVVLSVLIVIFLTDLEVMIIPDFLVNILIILNFITVILSDTQINYWDHLFAGFLPAIFLLSLNFLTKGAGMGLGDVKLVLGLGFLLGTLNTITWMSLSFIVGAVVGVFLIAIGKAKFGRQIPFGPFIILAFFIVYFFGSAVRGLLLPGF